EVTPGKRGHGGREHDLRLDQVVHHWLRKLCLELLRGEISLHTQPAPRARDRHKTRGRSHMNPTVRAVVTLSGAVLHVDNDLLPRRDEARVDELLASGKLTGLTLTRKNAEAQRRTRDGDDRLGRTVAYA